MKKGTFLVICSESRMPELLASTEWITLSYEQGSGPSLAPAMVTLLMEVDDAKSMQEYLDSTSDHQAYLRLTKEGEMTSEEKAANRAKAKTIKWSDL